MSRKLSCVTAAAVLALGATLAVPVTASAQAANRNDTIFATISLECHPHGPNAVGTRLVLVNKGQTVPGGTAVTITYREIPVFAGAKLAGANGDASLYPVRVITHRLSRSLGTGAVEVLDVQARECLSATYRRVPVNAPPLKTAP